jgi:hypothetical protein
MRGRARARPLRRARRARVILRGMAARVDVNSDLGEGFGPWRMGDDEQLLQVVTTASIACGFHAGDPVIMARTVALARRLRLFLSLQVPGPRARFGLRSPGCRRPSPGGEARVSSPARPAGCGRSGRGGSRRRRKAGRSCCNGSQGTSRLTPSRCHRHAVALLSASVVSHAVPGIRTRGQKTLVGCAIP